MSLVKWAKPRHPQERDVSSLDGLGHVHLRGAGPPPGHVSPNPQQARNLRSLEKFAGFGRLIMGCGTSIVLTLQSGN